MEIYAKDRWSIYIDFFYKPATHVLNYGALHTTTLGQKVFLKQSNTVKVEAFYEVQNFSLDCFNEESFSVVKQYTQFNMDWKSLCTERNFSKFYAKVSVKSWLLFILIFKDYDLEEKSWIENSYTHEKRIQNNFYGTISRHYLLLTFAFHMKILKWLHSDLHLKIVEYMKVEWPG